MMYQFNINFFLLRFSKEAERFPPRVQKARNPHQPPLLFREFRKFLLDQQVTSHELLSREYLVRHGLVLCYLQNLET